MGGKNYNIKQSFKLINIFPGFNQKRFLLSIPCQDDIAIFRTGQRKIEIRKR